MAVEIKEIVIRAVLTEEEKTGDSSEAHTMEKERLLQECIDHVLKVLKKKNYR
ncbi:MAG: DUF5908 family protein [Bacteroidota bacterium]